MASKAKLQFEKQQGGSSTLNRRVSTNSRVSRCSRHASSNSGMFNGKGGMWRGGQSGDGFKVPRYQNSYRLEPHMPFRFEVSDRILAQMMTNAFAGVAVYDPVSSVTLCREVAADVLDRLYKTDFDRVKYVVIVTMIENADQSFECACGRLWDADRDSYSTFVVERPSFYAYGIVHAVNYE